nr:radical SAM protein [Archaeoglobus profundus]
MRKFKRIEAGSFYSYLSEGCKLCRRGAKMVLFVTGICNNSCFYCPISEERRGKDVVFANEREVKRIEDAIEEANAMSAEGIAITGGEPLLKLDRVVEFLKTFKDLHSHLYTAIPAKESVLSKLKHLDEIRFHPPELRNVKAYEEPIKTAKKLEMDVGFEIPSIAYSDELVEITNKLDIFLNLNELEFSSTNYENLIAKGFRPNDHYGCSNCDEIIKAYAENVNKFHYCSARFKDKAQLRRRLIRMAKNLPDFYIITREGTVICGYIEGDVRVIEEFLQSKGLKRSEDYVVVEGGVETSVEFVEEYSSLLKKLGTNVFIIERYPTSKRVVVEVNPV